MTDPEERFAEEARMWIARMASGDMTGEQLATFKAWRAAHPGHDHAFAEQRALWRALDTQQGGEPPKPRRTARRPWRRRDGRMRRIVPKVAVAGVAALAALLVAPDFAIRLRADHRTDIAVESVTLPDGSTAMLDAQSAIALHFDGGERRIDLLRGDIWVRVAHGDRRPFRVAAQDGVVQDIGTAFEVARRDDEVTVSVTEGMVQVRADSGAMPITLRASERVRYGTAGASRLADARVGDMAAWRNGELLLHKASVRDAVQAIGRYRSGPVLLLGDGANTTRISAVFRTDRPDEAIDAVAQMAGLDVYRLAGLTLLRPSR